MTNETIEVSDEVFFGTTETKETNATVTKKRNTLSPEEQLKEFGSRRLRMIAAKIIPNTENLAKLEAYRQEVANAEEEAKQVPEQFRKFADKAVEGMRFRLHVMESNLAAGTSLSDHERNLLVVAAKRILKHCSATKNILAIAQFIEATAEENLPLIGTKH